MLVTKRSLSRLGYIDEGAGSTTAVSDPEMFRGLRKFQRKVGLAPDGIMKPEGPTAAYLGLLLEKQFQDANAETVRNHLVSSNSNGRPDFSQCDHLYWNVDIPTCRRILARRGKQKAARCFHTATARYAACLGGVPLNELPPLDTLNE